MSQRAYYFNSITNFILEDDESVLGQLLINDEFETTDLQKMAWRSDNYLNFLMVTLFLNIPYLEWDTE